MSVGYVIGKRCLDLLVSVPALLLLLPLCLLIAILIRLDSAGPVFFRQERVGRGGRPFGMIKFRSMVQGAAKLGSHSTAQNDARITRVGGWLRRSSLDELPQLLNVALGHMSLVGPRPDVPAQKSLYEPNDWQERTSVKPGITGLAQVNGRSSISFEQRLAHDLAYVRDCSLGMDLKLLMQSVSVVFGRSGSN